MTTRVIRWVVVAAIFAAIGLFCFCIGATIGQNAIDRLEVLAPVESGNWRVALLVGFTAGLALISGWQFWKWVFFRELERGEKRKNDQF